MTKMEVTNEKIVKDTSYAGSALILAVVLTTLLATVGVLFLLLSRIDKMAASAASQNRELNLAIDTVVAKISQELVLDVPGVAGREYYDYPGPEDRWLASLEPNDKQMWPQISDIYTKLGSNLRLQAVIVPDYQDAKIMCEGQIADADGDGAADSRWVVIPDVNSSKGRPIYAAIRIIDNGGMLNVNTAFKFNPADPCSGNIDGSSQLQINLMALSWRPGATLPNSADETDLLRARANYGVGVNPFDLRAYVENVIWRYGGPNGLYTPFDISDELEFRYRFLLNHEDIDTRLEPWGGQFRNKRVSSVPFQNLHEWFNTSCIDANLVRPPDPNYAYRHIATTCNMDRIIKPDGDRMLNINTASAQKLYGVLKGIIDPNLAAQLAVNIVDLRDNRDNDVNVTVLGPPVVPKTYYGFEAQPFISEIAFKIDGNNPATSANNYFAIELYNPFEVPIPLVGFRLELRYHPGGSVPVKTINLAKYLIPANSRFVIMNKGGLNDHIDPNLVLAKYYLTGSSPPSYSLAELYDIYLLRRTPAQDIYLDKQETNDVWFINWSTIKDEGQFYYRPDNNWNIVYQQMQKAGGGTLGAANGGGTKRNYNIPTFRGGFVTVGDIARVLTVGPSPSQNDMIGVRLAPQPLENSVRINLADPASYVQQIFNYLTVFDPAVYTWNDPNETRVKGRVNINTAPWFVIAQLPWMRYNAGADEYSRAKAIIRYRDTVGGFKGTAELMQVSDMRNLGSDLLDNLNSNIPKGPDLTDDTARDDFEERDVIFARISNLVTVRSDVFTAYILVRIGPNGPQRRVIAILDRSQVSSPTDKVKTIALHPVPDPR